MAGADLNFEGAYQAKLPADLVFGVDAKVEQTTTNIGIRGALPALGGKVTASVLQKFGMQGALPALGGKVKAKYVSNVQRPVVNDTKGRFQQADALRANWVREHYRQAVTLKTLALGRYQAALELDFSQLIAWSSASHTRFGLAGRFQQAMPLPVSQSMARYQEVVKYRTGLTDHFQQARQTSLAPALLRYQEAQRLKRLLTSVYQDALGLQAAWAQNEGYGVPFKFGWRKRYQHARRPPIGIWSREPVPPPVEKCYTPGLPADLIFIGKWNGTTGLVFVCDRRKDQNQLEPNGDTVIIPIRRVYFVINYVSLHRLSDGAPVPVIALSLALDVSSWAWSFDAQLPAAALDLIGSGTAFEPVKLAASINGTVYHLLAESISRERSFGSSSIRLSGRGHNAVLAAPYAPVMNFANSAGARTAQQLMTDVLKIKGIDIGWKIDWGLNDWNVPAGAWAHQGTWIDALTTIANSAGGYLVPHASQQSIKVRHRYPTVPWQWDTITPDFVLPSAVVARESLAWVDKPGYNRVFVSGQDIGVLGQATRTGTAGDVLAPMIVDPLITDVVAARQRSRTVLSDTGRQIDISLSLPVLTETGIIEPGAFVQYQDGNSTRIGIVRSNRVEATLPKVQQTLGVQSYG